MRVSIYDKRLNYEEVLDKVRETKESKFEETEAENRNEVEETESWQETTYDTEKIKEK
jgi:hypothetical protein